MSTTFYGRSWNIIITVCVNRVVEPSRDKTNKMACVPVNLESLFHLPRLILVLTVCLKAMILSYMYPLSAQRRLWSDWADAQADLSL